MVTFVDRSVCQTKVAQEYHGKTCVEMHRPPLNRKDAGHMYVIEGILSARIECS